MTATVSPLALSSFVTMPSEVPEAQVSGASLLTPEQTSKFTKLFLNFIEERKKLLDQRVSIQFKQKAAHINLLNSKNICFPWDEYSCCRWTAAGRQIDAAIEAQAKINSELELVNAELAKLPAKYKLMPDFNAPFDAAKKALDQYSYIPRNNKPLDKFQYDVMINCFSSFKTLPCTEKTIQVTMLLGEARLSDVDTALFDNFGRPTLAVMRTAIKCNSILYSSEEGVIITTKMSMALITLEKGRFSNYFPISFIGCNPSFINTEIPSKMYGIGNLQSEINVQEQQNLASIVKCAQAIDAAWRTTQAQIYKYLPTSMAEELLRMVIGYLGHVDVESLDPSINL